MENKMIINVNPALLEAIKTLEERERKESKLELNFFWAYSEDGNGATGESNYNHPHAEYDISVGKTFVTALRRKQDKWSNEGWETDPLDSDYEDDDFEEIEALLKSFENTEEKDN
jgi:hypothetical protein